MMSKEAITKSIAHNLKKISKYAYKKGVGLTPRLVGR